MENSKASANDFGSESSYATTATGASRKLPESVLSQHDTQASSVSGFTDTSSAQDSHVCIVDAHIFSVETSTSCRLQSQQQVAPINFRSFFISDLEQDVVNRHRRSASYLSKLFGAAHVEGLHYGVYFESFNFQEDQLRSFRVELLIRPLL